jgi:hypothetical protein
MRRRALQLAIAAVTTIVIATTAASAAGGPPFGPPATKLLLFGHVASLKPVGHRWLLGLDPALWLSGKTASDYALATTGSPDVPNDHIVFDPDHTVLTYYLGADAKVTVVANHGGITARRITVPELVRVLRGTLKTFEPHNPFWVVASGDTILELDQQYSP